MMNNFFPFGGFAFFHFFGIFALVGFVLLTVWAIKNLSKERLLNWAIALLVIGIFGSVLAMGFGGSSWNRGFGSFGMMGPYMMGGAAGCQNDEQCWNRMEQFGTRMMQNFFDYNKQNAR